MDLTDPDTTRWLFRLPRSQIAYVRFIVESYEGLAQICSPPGRGEVVWIVPRSRVAEALQLAAALAPEVGLVRVGGDAQAASEELEQR